MLLLIFIVIYFPVYFGLRHVIPLREDLTIAGAHAIIACVVTFLLVVGLTWLKDRVWG